MTASVWERLREPFPKEAIQQIDKGWGPMDYVDQALVTDRLIQVDPEYKLEHIWTIDDEKMLESKCSVGVILRLTINGVSREEFGDGANLKEAFSDGLKRCAMRFGVALDLWGKQGNGHVTPSKQTPAPNPAAKAQAAQTPSHAPTDGKESAVLLITSVTGPNERGWYEIVAGDYTLTTKKIGLVGAAKGAQGHEALVMWTEKQNGAYTNRYLESVEFRPAGGGFEDPDSIPF
jgi:hypothetical protein